MPDDGFLDFVLDQLDGAGEMTTRRMFGAVGVYLDGTFMAIVDDGRLYFKVDDATVDAFRRHGMKAFAPTPDMTLKTYFEVPVDVLEDDRELRRWALAARDAARRHRVGRPGSR